MQNFIKKRKSNHLHVIIDDYHNNSFTLGDPVFIVFTMLKNKNLINWEMIYS